LNPQNDTLVIKYTIELVVSSGGALSRAAAPSRAELIRVPPPCLGRDLAALFASGSGADHTMVCEGEEMPVHRIVLAARSRVFDCLLNAPMREGAAAAAAAPQARASRLGPSSSSGSESE